MGEIEALTIGAGCEVTMHFTLSLEDGTIADASIDGEPMVFTMGDGSLIEGLEMVLYGLKVGDKQSLSIEPRDTFGFPDDENVHTLARTEFSDDMKIEEGMIIGFNTPSGDEIPGAIMEIKDDKVKVDFNHPLAGHEVVFNVEIVDLKLAQS
ncbi:MAG: FKBP-type peptidyl-prolyl cis-trans isomerase [Woeseiaceae bacterium]